VAVEKEGEGGFGDCALVLGGAAAAGPGLNRQGWSADHRFQTVPRYSPPIHSLSARKRN